MLKYDCWNWIKSSIEAIDIGRNHNTSNFCWSHFSDDWMKMIRYSTVFYALEMIFNQFFKEQNRNTWRCKFSNSFCFDSCSVGCSNPFMGPRSLNTREWLGWLHTLFVSLCLFTLWLFLVFHFVLSLELLAKLLRIWKEVVYRKVVRYIKIVSVSPQLILGYLNMIEQILRKHFHKLSQTVLRWSEVDYKVIIFWKQKTLQLCLLRIWVCGKRRKLQAVQEAWEVFSVHNHRFSWKFPTPGDFNPKSDLIFWHPTIILSKVPRWKHNSCSRMIFSSRKHCVKKNLWRRLFIPLRSCYFFDGMPNRCG